MRTDFIGENAEEKNILSTAIIKAAEMDGMKFKEDEILEGLVGISNSIGQLHELGYEIKKKDQWISVKDRLPETDGYKIVVIQWENSDPAVDTARYFVKEKTFSSVVNSHITHWQLLPENPKK